MVAALTSTHDHAPDHWLPSTKMYCVAPVERMALIAAWLRATTRFWSMVLYSLLVSKMTLLLSLNRVASLVQKEPKAAVSVIMASL